MFDGFKSLLRYLFDRSEIKKGDKFILDDVNAKNPFKMEKYIVEVKCIEGDYVNYRMNDFF